MRRESRIAGAKEFPPLSFAMNNREKKTVSHGRPYLLASVMGMVLSIALLVIGSFPIAETSFIGAIATIVVGYRVPPRPQLPFVSWILQRTFLALCFYLALFKIPLPLKRIMPATLAYAIPFVLSIVVLITWARYWPGALPPEDAEESDFQTLDQ